MLRFLLIVAAASGSIASMYGRIDLENMYPSASAGSLDPTGRFWLLTAYSRVDCISGTYFELST